MLSILSHFQLPLVDIIALNRYYGWYVDIGHTEIITNMMVKDVKRIAEYCQKPILIAEYGADTVAGLHRVRQPYSIFNWKKIASRFLLSFTAA